MRIKMVWAPPYFYGKYGNRCTYEQKELVGNGINVAKYATSQKEMPVIRRRWLSYRHEYSDGGDDSCRGDGCFALCLLEKGGVHRKSRCRCSAFASVDDACNRCQFPLIWNFCPQFWVFFRERFAPKQAGKTCPLTITWSNWLCRWSSTLPPRATMNRRRWEVWCCYASG